MGRYMCIVKTYQWGRLLTEGDIIDLPVGTKLPHGTKKNTRTGKDEKVPYFRFLNVKKSVAGAPHIAQREIKMLKNRLSSLYNRTNLTPGEEAERERIQDRLASVDKGTSLGISIPKEETLARKKEEIEAVSGTQPMSMAQTQKMKYDKYNKAKAEKE